MAESYTEITLGAAASGTNGVDNVNHGPWTFDYINTGDIEVRVKVSSTWHPIVVSSVNTTTKIVTLAAAPNVATSGGGAGAAESDTLRIYRATSLSPIVDFQAGSRIAEADLDNAYRQGLFAAQEVAEDAHTTGGAGATALTANSVELSHMTDNSVDTPELVDDSVTAAKIDDGAVGAAALASTLDLSDKTVTLNATTLNLSGAQFGGILPLAKGGTGLSAKAPGTILEYISGPCDGHTVTKSTGVGTHIFPSAAAQVLTGTHETVSGSLFNYTPPSGTKWVSYELNFTISRDDTFVNSFGMFKFWLGEAGGASDGSYTEVTNAKFGIGNSSQHGDRATFKWVIPIDSSYQSGGAPYGAIDSWGASRHLKLTARHWAYSSDIRNVKLNQLMLWDDDASTGEGNDDTNAESTLLSAPTLTVIASL